MEKSNLTGRLMRFCNNLALAYFLGHSVYNWPNFRVFLVSLSYSSQYSQNDHSMHLKPDGCFFRGEGRGQPDGQKYLVVAPRRNMLRRHPKAFWGFSGTYRTFFTRISAYDIISV